MGKKVHKVRYEEEGSLKIEVDYDSFYAAMQRELVWFYWNGELDEDEAKAMLIVIKMYSTPAEWEEFLEESQ